MAFTMSILERALMIPPSVAAWLLPVRDRVVQLLGAPSCGFSVNDDPIVVPQSGLQRLPFLRVRLIMVRPVAAEAGCRVLDAGLRSLTRVGQMLGELQLRGQGQPQSQNQVASLDLQLCSNSSWS